MGRAGYKAKLTAVVPAWMIMAAHGWWFPEKQGEAPACVRHCMAGCMKYGKVEDLAKEMAAKPRMVLWAPR